MLLYTTLMFLRFDCNFLYHSGLHHDTRIYFNQQLLYSCVILVDDHIVSDTYY
jgi:hypothetical protein